jgi:hypothetical protein
MTAGGTLILLNCMDLEKAVPVLLSETCPASCYSADQFIGFKF